MSKYKEHAREAKRRGYWVGGDGVVNGLRGPRSCHNTTSGYPRFSIHLAERRNAHVLVHQLAALQLWGERAFSDGVVVVHLDRNKENNRPDNLALGSRSDAQMMIPRCLRILYGANAARKLRLLTDAQVTELRAMRAAGATLETICERFRIAKSTASYVVNRRTYS